MQELNQTVQTNLMPNVSVIIPTHARPDLLPRTVQSAREAGTGVEIIVVDDASTDATAEVCRTLSDIRYVRVDRNQGVAGARNIGLVASSSEYVCFLDDDDVRLPTSLDQQTRILDQTPEAMLVYAQAIPEYADGTCGQPFPSEFPQGDIFWDLLIKNFIPSGSVVFRRSCIAQIGLLDDTIPGIDDWDLWIRIAELFPAAAMETPVLIWRQSTINSEQGSSATLNLIECGRKRLRQDWLRLPRAASAPSDKRKMVWREFSKNIAEHLAWETFAAVRNSQFIRAWRAVGTLLQLHPSALALLAGRWASASTIATLFSASVHHEELPNARAHFRQLRSNMARQ